MGNFIGHSDIINSFKKRAINKSLSHAHLIVGVDGIGKSKLARIFALQVVDGVDTRQYVDIIDYSPKKASFGVDEIRELISEVNKKPFEGNKKVIIIHEGNKLTIQAQNALLKTIEEPPSGVFIIMLCESLELVLDTIKSRCQIYKLTPLSKDEIYEYIESIKGDATEAQILASLAYSEGIPGRAERLLTDNSLNNLRELLLDVLSDANNGSSDILLKHENLLLAYKDNKDEILNILTSFIRDIMIYKELNDTNLIINSDKIDSLKKLAIGMSYKKLNKVLDKIKEARINLLSNSNFAITIRVMVIGFMEG
ncbi:MAG: DNA polymerase III subunit delta' [Terrisporobacter sp.]|uniref:DNA polymerase III subunit delta' n=1 Tax=Clostridia TaxID=186801 RepID=UPI002FC9D44D